LNGTLVKPPGPPATGVAGNRLRVGTRGSALALAQAGEVVARIAGSGGPPCETMIIRTSGDRVPLAADTAAEGKRMFVKELEDALLRHAIDLAVHSCKDLPVALPAGLELAAVLPRATPWDALVLPASAAQPPPAVDAALSPQGPFGWMPASAGMTGAVVRALGPSPRVGTGSIRRTAELSRLLPGARFLPIRGNVDTRLRKLDGGEYDVLVLAAAGLERLGVADRISCLLPVDVSVPSSGQGVIAIEARAGDMTACRAAAAVSDPVTAAAVAAERSLVAALGGGCRTPVGAVALPVDGDLELHAAVLSLDGRRAVRGIDRGPQADAAELGRRLARRLVAEGAAAILEEVRRV
jgi:hydroxymethylbilane synthase